MDKIVRIFLLKLAQNSCFFYTLAAICNIFANDLECYFFLNDVDIQLILEFNNSFGKYHPINPKNP